jgi:hypothetical protein
MFNLCAKLLNTKHIEALTPEILTLTLSFEIEPDKLMLKNILKLRGKLKNYMGLNDKSYMKLVDKKLAEYGVLIDEEEK